MNRVPIVVLGLLLACSGCGNQVAQNGDSRWLLMASPGTSDYPWGWSHMPLTQWQPLIAYPSEATCDRSLRDAQNIVQSPVTCVAANDKQLKYQTGSSLVMSSANDTASGPLLSSLAIAR